MSELPSRKIIHVDMDAFYASVEELDNPELRGKAIAVGGGVDRGVVSAASYEARKFGVRSAMAGALARKLCPELIFVPPNFERYKEISAQIHAVFNEYTDLIEPLSLDEAYLDVTQNKVGMPSATVIASWIRERIKEKTGLNASAGISINKFVAKVASDINKPNGQKTIPPEEVIDFLEQLDIRKFYGIGEKTAQKMYLKGIFTGADLKLKTREWLSGNFGKSGVYYYDIVRGIQHSEVKPNRIRKSLAAERTFRENITSEVFMLEKLEHIAAEVAKRLAKSKVAGKTVTLKIKYSDFTLKTRSKTIDYYVRSKEIILEIAKDLLYQEKLENSVRLLGISISSLNTEDKKKAKPKKEEEIDVQMRIEF